MQETWKFDIERATDVPEEDFIKGLIEEKRKEMGIFLSYYFKKDGAVVENVEINSEIKTLGQGLGKFQVKFDLVFFNACLNIHDQNKDKLKIDYLIDGKSVILTGPYWPERGQDEI